MLVLIEDAECFYSVPYPFCRLDYAAWLSHGIDVLKIGFKGCMPKIYSTLYCDWKIGIFWKKTYYPSYTFWSKCEITSVSGRTNSAIGIERWDYFPTSWTKFAWQKLPVDIQNQCRLFRTVQWCVLCIIMRWGIFEDLWAMLRHLEQAYGPQPLRLP